MCCTYHVAPCKGKSKGSHLWVEFWEKSKGPALFQGAGQGTMWSKLSGQGATQLVCTLKSVPRDSKTEIMPGFC